MMTQRIVTTMEDSDAQLVSRTLAGDRDAFSRIVARYQILICSLAYSRIGHLGPERGRGPGNVHHRLEASPAPA